MRKTIKIRTAKGKDVVIISDGDKLTIDTPNGKKSEICRAVNDEYFIFGMKCCKISEFADEIQHSECKVIFNKNKVD